MSQHEQKLALHAIRSFLQSKSSFDVLPVSYRVVVLDSALLVKRALGILLQNSIVSAPLWSSSNSKFVGLLTAKDFLYMLCSDVDWDSLTLDGLKNLSGDGIESVSINPLKSLYDACLKMLQSSARRIPLVDVAEDDPSKEIVVSVLTQYRILKFVSMNCKETRFLQQPLAELDIGTMSNFSNIVTANLQNSVVSVIHLLVNNKISAVPIVDEEGKLINVYEAVDVLSLMKSGMATDPQLTVGEALLKRSDDFEGVYTCTLSDTLFVVLETIRKSRLHRLFVLDNQGALLGVMTLGDILKYILFQ